MRGWDFPLHLGVTEARRLCKPCTLYLNCFILPPCSVPRGIGKHVCRACAMLTRALPG